MDRKILGSQNSPVRIRIAILVVFRPRSGEFPPFGKLSAAQRRPGDVPASPGAAAVFRRRSNGRSLTTRAGRGSDFPFRAGDRTQDAIDADHATRFLSLSRADTRLAAQPGDLIARGPIVFATRREPTWCRRRNDSITANSDVETTRSQLNLAQVKRKSGSTISTTARRFCRQDGRRRRTN